MAGAKTVLTKDLPLNFGISVPKSVKISSADVVPKNSSRTFQNIESGYKCSTCDKVFETLDALIFSCKEHNEESDQRTSNFETLKMISTNESHVPTGNCNLKLLTDALFNHSTHEKIEFTCSVCRTSYDDYLKLRAHLVLSHKIDIPDFLNATGKNECPISTCTKEFGSKIYLVTHLRREHRLKLEFAYSQLGAKLKEVTLKNYGSTEDSTETDDDFFWNGDDRILENQETVVGKEAKRVKDFTGNTEVFKCFGCNFIYPVCTFLKWHLEKMHGVKAITYLLAEKSKSCHWCSESPTQKFEEHLQEAHLENLVQLYKDLGMSVPPGLKRSVLIKNCYNSSSEPFDSRPKFENSDQTPNVAPKNLPLKLTSIRNGANEYLCPHCPKKLLMTQLRYHMENTHNLYEDCRECPFCHSTWPSLKGLKAHMLYLHQTKFLDWMKEYTQALVHNGPVDFDYCSECFLPLKPEQVTAHQQIVHNLKKVNIKCHHCSQRFDSFESRANHERTQHPQMEIPMFTCDICGITVKTKYRIIDHLQIHIRKNETKDNYKPVEYFKCPECRGKFLNRQGLINHRRKTHGIAREVLASNGTKKRRRKMSGILKGEEDFFFYCQFCNKRHKSEVYKLRHEKLCKKAPIVTIESNKTEYVCEICHETFDTAAGLRIHTGRQHTEKRYDNPIHICDVCGKTFQSLRGFLKHKLVHKSPDTEDTPNQKKKTTSTSPTFVCEICTNQFNTPTLLNMHVKMVHKKGTMFSCRSCNFQTDYKATLRVHCSQTHGHELPLSEDEDEDPVIKKSLTKSDGGTFCPICNVLIKNKYYLTQHIRLHGPRNFCCPQCEKAFPGKSQLNLHIRKTHSGEKPDIPCHYCTEVFKDYRKRRKHEERKHNVKGEKKADRIFLEDIIPDASIIAND